MKISASLYSNTDRPLVEMVKELDGHRIDMFHIDSNDNLGVFNDIEAIRKVSDTAIDLHVISESPEAFYQGIESFQLEYVQFQFEQLKQRIRPPKISGTRYGLAIVSETPVEVFTDYADDFDFILLMTTVPGKSGGTFEKENFKKIRKFRNLFPGKQIHVDGGVNDEVSFILRNMGVHSSVSGSYLMKNESFGKALLNLKTHEIHSHYQISDFMIDPEDLPVLPIDQADIRQVIKTIDAYNLGFTFFENNDGTFAGLSSNADVRHGLVKHLDDLNQVTLQEIVNANPISIRPEATISEMLSLIARTPFPVNFLPVVSHDKRLSGALTFFNLIRGEI